MINEESRKIKLEIEFSNVGASQFKLLQWRRINIVNIQRSVDNVLEASLGQGFESWSWYLSFEDL